MSAESRTEQKLLKEFLTMSKEYQISSRFPFGIRDDIAKLYYEVELLHSKMFDVREYCKCRVDNSAYLITDMDSAVRSLSDAMDSIAYAMEDLDNLIENGRLASGPDAEEYQFKRVQALTDTR